MRPNHTGLGLTLFTDMKTDFTVQLRPIFHCDTAAIYSRPTILMLLKHH